MDETTLGFLQSQLIIILFFVFYCAFCTIKQQDSVTFTNKPLFEIYQAFKNPRAGGFTVSFRSLYLPFTISSKAISDSFSFLFLHIFPLHFQAQKLTTLQCTEKHPYIYALIYSQIAIHTLLKMSFTISTIFDSFFSPLPNFKVHDEAVYRKASTAASTKQEEPLRALRWEDCTSISGYGRQYFTNTSMEEDDILCQQTPVPLRQTKTEAHVTAQAVLHVLYQVNHVLNRHLQDGWVEGSLELSFKGDTIMRTDYLWSFNPHNGSAVSFRST